MDWRDMLRDDRPVYAALVLMALASQLSVAASQILLGVALLMALVRWLSGKDRPLATGVELPALLLVGWALLMIPFSPRPEESLIFARRFYLFTALWLCAWYVRSESRRAAVLIALLTGAVINCVYTIVTQAWLPGDFTRRLSMIQHTTITGSWLVMCAAVIALAFVIHGRGVWLRILASVSMAPLLAALVLTQSRSAWLGFVAGAAVTVALRRKRLVLVLTAGIVALFVLGPDTYRDRMRTIVDPTFRTNVQRFTLWETGWDLVKEHPLIGVGDRNLSEYSPVYLHGRERREVKLPHLHSNPVMLAVIWGLPGLALGTWFMIALGVRLWQRHRVFGRQVGRSPPLRPVWIAAALGVWIAVNVSGLFDWSFGDPELSLVFFATCGIALSLDDPVLSGISPAWESAEDA